jgi:hypothetical protein
MREERPIREPAQFIKTEPTPSYRERATSGYQTIRSLRRGSGKKRPPARFLKYVAPREQNPEVARLRAENRRLREQLRRLRA